MGPITAGHVLTVQLPRPGSFCYSLADADSVLGDDAEASGEFVDVGREQEPSQDVEDGLRLLVA